MNVLVTGGTGFVGGEIVRELHRAGHKIHLLVRDPASRRAQELADRFGAQLRPGNVLDNTSVLGICMGVDAVIHLVGIISEVNEQTFDNVHVGGTLNIVGAASRVGVKRFLYMSALGTRPEALARYHQSKWAAEELVRRSGLNWTIFRPSIIFGPDDGFVNLFARIIRKSPVVPVIGGGQTKFQPVPVESVARAFVEALSEPLAIRQTYDLCGVEVWTLDGIVDEILAVMGRKRWKLHIPPDVARWQASLLEFIYPRLLGKAPPLNRDQVLMLQEDNVGEPEAAEELFGLPRVRFGEGIAEYL